MAPLHSKSKEVFRLSKKLAGISGSTAKVTIMKNFNVSCIIYFCLGMQNFSLDFLNPKYLISTLVDQLKKRFYHSCL